MKKISIQTEDGMDLEIFIPNISYNHLNSLRVPSTRVGCSSRWAGWYCTRVDVHKGEHVAHGKYDVHAVWEKGDE